MRRRDRAGPPSARSTPAARTADMARRDHLPGGQTSSARTQQRAQERGRLPAAYRPTSACRSTPVVFFSSSMRLHDVVGDLLGQRAGAVGGDHGELVDRRHRRRHLARHLAAAPRSASAAPRPRCTRRTPRPASPSPRPRPGRWPGSTTACASPSARSGSASATRRGLLGLTALGALDRLGLGQRGPAGLVALTGEAGLLGVGLGGGDRRLPAGVGLEHLGVAACPRPPSPPGSARRRRACAPRCRAGAP